MAREDLIRHIHNVLNSTGFSIFETPRMRSICFDFVAKKDNILLFVKALTNVDSFSEQNAEELKVLSEALEGSPMLIGERSSSGEIENGVVYSRFGIPIMSMETFIDFFQEGIFPLAMAKPGGFYVFLDRHVLGKARKELGLSLGDMASAGGVSRRTIQMYEEGMNAMVDVALRLEDFLGTDLIKPVNPLEFEIKKSHKNLEFPIDPLFQQIYKSLETLGYNIVPTSRCPFDAFTKDKEIVLLSGISPYDNALKEKARSVTSISEIVGRDAVIFIEKMHQRTSIEGTPVIGRDELDHLKEANQVLDLLLERKP